MSSPLQQSMPLPGGDRPHRSLGGEGNPRDSDAPSDTRRGASHALPAASTPQGRCLLIAEPSRATDAIAQAIARGQAQVLHAGVAGAALALLDAHDDIALACIDLQMPGIDAVAWVERLRVRGLPLVVVGDSEKDAEQDAGFTRCASGPGGATVDLLLRPLQPHALEDRVAQALQLHHGRRQLRDERKACDDAMRLNAMFADVLGHDLRSPLSAILMSAEILKRRPDAALQKTGERLSRSANWMSRMIQDLLDLTRSRLGQGLALQRTQGDLAPLLEAVVAERKPAFPDNPLQLDLRGSLAGTWDAGRVQQLLSGLVGNALHHGEPGQPVSVRADGTAAESVRIDIRNHGTIAPALLPQLFDPLQAAHGGRRPSPPEGLGFGLYIARQIALAHGGDVTLQSDARSGTRVQVTLPRHAAVAADAGSAAAVPGHASAQLSAVAAV